MRYFSVLTMLLIVSPVLAQTKNADRYKGFLFEPVFSDKSVEDFAGNYLQLSGYMQEWHEVKKIHAFKVSGNEVWAAYEINVDKEKENHYYAFKDNALYIEKRKLAENERPNIKGVIKINNNADATRITYRRTKKDPADIWYPGTFLGSSYGCIDDEVIFKANLIEGESPYVFVITSMRDQFGINFTGNSFIRLSVYKSDSAEFQFDEYPMLWSVNRVNNNFKVSSQMTHFEYWQEYFGIDWGMKRSESFSSYLELSRFSKKEFEKEISLWGDEEWGLVAGRYQFAKFFVGDFDKDGYLELLFWHKRYRAKNKSAGLGFSLEKEYFTIYKEDVSGKSFIKNALTEEEGAALLGKANLSWDGGWPQNNQLCVEKMKANPTSSRGLTLDRLQ